MPARIAPDTPATAPDSPQGGLASRRRSIAISDLLAKIEHDLVLVVDCSSVTAVSGKSSRTEVASGEELEIGAYDINNLSLTIREQLCGGQTVAAAKYHILRCGSYVSLLSDRAIAIRLENLKYLVTCGPVFAEIVLDPDVDEDEIELFEDLLKAHTKFRVKGQPLQKGVTPVVIGQDGRPLEAGIGEAVGIEVRSACHFLAKRLRETRPEMNASIKRSGRWVRGFFKKCPEGAELRVQQSVLDNLRRAGLVVENAKKSIFDNKGMLRGVASQSGKAAGENIMASERGQRLLNNRALGEARKVTHATFDGVDEVFAAAKGLPDQLIKAVQQALEDIVGHMFGDRMQEASRLSFDLLTAMLSIKYAAQWAFPTALALTGQKHLFRVLSDNPSAKALQAVEARNERQTAEVELRESILKRLPAGK